MWEAIASFVSAFSLSIIPPSSFPLFMVRIDMGR
jgi:hypothetical protein